MQYWWGRRGRELAGKGKVRNITYLLTPVAGFPLQQAEKPFAAANYRGWNGFLLQGDKGDHLLIHLSPLPASCEWRGLWLGPLVMASCSVPENLYTITFEQSFFIYVVDPLSFLSFISFPQVVFFFLHFVFTGDSFVSFVFTMFLVWGCFLPIWRMDFFYISKFC